MRKIYRLMCYTICFMMILVPITSNVSASENIHGVDPNNFNFDSDYTFSFKYMEGITTHESSPNAVMDNGKYKFGGSNNDINMFLNNSWVLYKNVGIYNNKIIDVKVTLTGYDQTLQNDFFVRFYKDFQIDMHNIRGAKFKYQFYEHNTNNEISLKGHMTFSDIDNGQGISIVSGGSNIYYQNGSWFHIEGNKLMSNWEQFSDDWDKFAWATVLYTSPLTVSYETPDDSYFSPIFGFSPNAVASFDTPNISKYISDTNIHNTDDYYYELNFDIPDVPQEYAYSQFEISDTFSVSATKSENITITNEFGKDVSNLFNVDLSDENKTIKLTLKNNSDMNAYGHNYKVKIKVNKIKGSDVSPFNNNVPNTTSITTNKGTKTSNTVYNKFNHNITTSVTNGTITQGKEGVDATTNHTISYAPSDSDRYVLDKVTVNDNAVDITKNPESYTITNINDDYNISVNYKRVYVIDTSVNNKNWGTVDERITKINSGESKKISYKANDGYYIESLIVDGKTMPYEYNKHKDGYTFSDISADHTIQVVFKPYMSASVTKEIYDTTQGGNKKLTPNDLKSPDYNINTKNKDGIIPFILSMKDETTGEYQIIMYTNTEPFKIDFLKVGHTYTISEFPSLLVKFHSFIKPQNNNIFTGNNTLNKITFTISSEANKRDTYNIISKSVINYSLPSFEDTKDNLFKKFTK